MNIARGLGLIAVNAPADTPIPAGVPTSTLSPVFAFSGRGGNSRYLTRVDKNDFEPRFGFAYAPRFFGFNEPGDKSLYIRGGYGVSHVVLTGFNTDASPDLAVSPTNFNQDSGAVNPGFATRLSSNAPNLVPTASGFLPIPENGLVTGAGVYDLLRNGNVNAYAISPDFEVPYVQSWNLSLSYELLRNTVVEVAYVGNKGTNLFNVPLNINNRPFESVEGILNNGFDASQDIADPLGRGGNVQRGAFTSPYLGVNRLNVFFNPGVNSIRHAGYVSFQSRFSQGLSFTANYTYGKSIDESSDAGGNLGAGPFIGSGRSQEVFGGTRRGERSVSSYDIKHSFASTLNYELPFGRGRAFFSDAPKLLDAILGGYAINSIVRVSGGTPLQIFLNDSNQLGIGATNDSRVRPNIVPGVPLRNPLYSGDCPVFPGCEPIVNPTAFIRPPKGQLGNAPRTLDSVRAPTREFLDVSIHKNFRFSEDGRRSVQLRLDVLNVFNHPNFNPRTEGFVGLPNENTIIAGDYDAFAQVNNRPLSNTPAGAALLTQVQNFVTANRIPGGTQLPAAFFSVPVPEGFHTLQPNSFDITTLDGYKLYRLRQAYNQNFAGLQNDSASTPRYLQFGIKLYF